MVHPTHGTCKGRVLWSVCGRDRVPVTMISCSLAGSGFSLDSFSCVKLAPRKSSWQSTPSPLPEVQPLCLSLSTQSLFAMDRLANSISAESAGQQQSLWWIISILPSEPLLLYSPQRFHSPLSPSIRGFPSVRKSLLLHGALSEAQVLVPNSFGLYFSIYFALLHSVEISLPFWKSGVFCQLESVLKDLFHM